MANEYGYRNPFTVCFTSMKLRYHDYDNTISELGILSSNDVVNVFISFESVLNNLSCIPDLDNKLILERNFPRILESEMINLCAHYKRFFRGNGLPVRIFLYCTDLGSESFSEFKYNEEYRSYYCNKYLRNPKFRLLGGKLMDEIIPRVCKIMEFIPGVYFLRGINMEGSLIPAIVSNIFPNDKNFIVTTDKFECQYMLRPNFCTHYIKKSKLGTSIQYTYDKFITDYLKDDQDIEGVRRLYMNPSFFGLLHAVMGDKLRSVDSMKGIGTKTISNMIRYGLHNGVITQNTNSIELLKELFAREQQESAVSNFNCISLMDKLRSVNEENMVDIRSQLVDRFDYNSLIRLNMTDYSEYPLMLEELTT